MDCLVGQARYRECSEGSSKVLQCAEADPLESGAQYTGVCSEDELFWDFFSEKDVDGASFYFVRRCRLCFAPYGQEEGVGGSSDVYKGACFVAL